MFCDKTKCTQWKYIFSEMQNEHTDNYVHLSDKFVNHAENYLILHYIFNDPYTTWTDTCTTVA